MILLGILLLSALLRIVLTSEHFHHPLFTFTRIDEVFYLGWARNVMKGVFYFDDVPIHGPGYPWFLGIAFIIFRDHMLVPRILQILLGLGSILYVHRIVRRLHGETAALVSALLFGLFWPFLIFEQRILEATLFLFLNMLSLFLALWSLESRSVFKWGLTGLVIGCAMIVRPTALFWLLGLLLWLLIRFVRQKAPSLLIPAASLAIAAAIAIAPVMIKNYTVEKKFYLVQRHLGLNLFLGNNPDSDGTPYARVGQAWDRVMAMPVKEKGITAHAEQERFYIGKVFAFMKEEPLSFAWLQLKKLGLLLNNRELRSTIDPSFHRRLFRTLSMPLPGFGLALGLALSGLLAIRFSRSDHWLFMVYLLSYAFAIMLGPISSRYRVPFSAGVLIMSGPGVIVLLQSVFRLLSLPPRPMGMAVPPIASKRSSLLAFALIILGLVIAFLPTAPKYTDAEEWTYLGYAWRMKGNMEQALLCCEKALQVKPDDAGALVLTARIKRAGGRMDEAIEALRRAERSEPENSLVLYDLGMNLWQTGQKEEAIRHLNLALECKPFWIDALKALALFEWETGDLDNARRHIEAVLAQQPNLKEAQELLHRIISSTPH